MDACPFCQPKPETVFYENQLVLGLWDGFPLAKGHALVVTRRHVAGWFDTTTEERQALVEAIPLARQKIVELYPTDGFNLGVNVGAVAGQTVPHVHLHVIPRVRGDVADPRGGVRHVLPESANYLAAQGPTSAPVLLAKSGAELRSHLKDELPLATRLDVAVAKVDQGGAALLSELLRGLVEPGCQVRLVTSDAPPAALAALGPAVQVRLLPESVGLGTRTYLLHFRAGRGAAWVGATDLTRAALTTGQSWSYRVGSNRDLTGFEQLSTAFEALFGHPEAKGPAQGAQVATPPVSALPTPTAIQAEALAALEETRRQGRKAGLVVLATGLGKTWLSVFDSLRPEFKRILFVAHRQEILDQAKEAFLKVRPDATVGFYTGTANEKFADLTFAMVQTLGKNGHLRKFDRNAFDYVVVDEFHHASAGTYLRLIEHFQPKFLLGLTATPERTDGDDLLRLCENNLVYRCDLVEGIKRASLSPFDYFGLPDDVDYEKVTWRGARFDEAELTRLVSTDTRAQHILEQWQQRKGDKTLAFCVSKSHADFMAKYFSSKGIRTAVVHSDPTTSADRKESLAKLAKGELDIVFSVDMFNEGVDVPSIDTVLMLRPTESKILWLQQLGRGLRLQPGKKLKVIDYIGNHRTFLSKVRVLLQAPDGDSYALRKAISCYAQGTYQAPPGCTVTFETQAIDILQQLLRPKTNLEAFKDYYSEFKGREGQRPTALESFQDGFGPEIPAGAYKHWLGFVEAQGDLPHEYKLLAGLPQEFLVALHTTDIQKSYKLVVLLAMLESGTLPGSISIADLADGVLKIARRNPWLASDFAAYTPPASARKDLKAMLIRNPINAWIGGNSGTPSQFFAYSGGTLSFLPPVPNEAIDLFQQLVQELADWRLEAHFRSPARNKIVSGGPTGAATVGPKLWGSYLRPDIPPLFGEVFSDALWNQGFLARGSNMFLLVTLDKSESQEAHQYRDGFTAPTEFNWESQNRARQDNAYGKPLLTHKANGKTVHLFVRSEKKRFGKPMPFIYCGPVEFISWEGNEPISVKWRLLQPVPAHLRSDFKVP
jgi:superfamily II DNA or RNA helicase/diadenosine tetraphosphate (Ap4A) HIT family hydrolase/HKD family nuclease